MKKQNVINIKDVTVGERFNYTTPDGDAITAYLRDGGTMGGCEFDLYVALEKQGYTEGLPEVETFDSEAEEVGQ